MSSATSEMPEVALAAAERLINFYPAINAADPRVFAAGLVQLFSRYPEHLIAEALDPVHGLPGTCEFLPTIAKVRGFLEPRYLAWLKQKDMQERFNRKRLEAPPRDPDADKQMASQFKSLADHLSVVPDVIEVMKRDKSKAGAE
jgi:hypothetical protein